MHVQGFGLKTGAALYTRLLNSPTTIGEGNVRALIIIAFVLAYGPTQAQAIFDGNKLKDFCESPEASPKWSMCVGYISGFIDGNLKPPFFNGSPDFCLANGVTDEQLRTVLLKYFERYPEKLHYAGFTLVNVALNEAFPCK